MTPFAKTIELLKFYYLTDRCKMPKNPNIFRN